MPIQGHMRAADGGDEGFFADAEGGHRPLESDDFLVRGCFKVDHGHASFAGCHDDVAPLRRARGQGPNPACVQVDAGGDGGTIQGDDMDASKRVSDQEKIALLSVRHRQQDARNRADGDAPFAVSCDSEVDAPVVVSHDGGVTVDEGSDDCSAAHTSELYAGGGPIFSRGYLEN